MTASRLYNTKAIVLKKNELGEADNILTLYTPHRGKLRAVAKGVRRPKSKLGGHTELLTYSEMLLARSKNLDIITQSQNIESFTPLRNDLLRTSQALYVVELVDRFTAEEEENYPLFMLLVNTMHWLCQARHSELILRYFEIRLFEQSSLEPGGHFFTPSGGGVLCPRCHDQEPVVYAFSVNALKVMRFLQRSDYTSVDRLRLNPGLSLELKRLMQGYIRYLLEREVKSAEWLDRLEKEGLSLG
jgi:DNA repair protein RecO (recombination protein O)